MSAILYNTNSSLIPKFQKYDLLKQSKESPNTIPASKTPSLNDRSDGSREDVLNSADIPFRSDNFKESDAYLKELCCSIYPVSLHSTINQMTSMTDLKVNAFFGLIFKNFVCSWYGPKIPTSDDQFIIHLFKEVQGLIIFIRTRAIEYESLLADDLPKLLSDHIDAMKRVRNDEDIYKAYCNFTGYESGYYPATITGVVKSGLDNDSQLQSTFLDSLFNSLLFGKIADRIAEPYYLLRAISSICSPLLLRHSRSKQLGQNRSPGIINRCATKLRKTCSELSILIQNSKGTTAVAKVPLPYRYIFTFISCDILKLPSRRPYLYAIGKTLQFWSAKSAILNKIMHHLFKNVVEDRFLNENTIGKLFSCLRQLLFPNDNMMGPGTMIPTGEAFETVKEECRADLREVLKSQHLLGLDEKDGFEWIEILCKDKACNKILFFKILDCILAHLQDSDKKC